MKRFLKFAFAAFAVVALANCTNDIDEQPAHETTGGTVKLCVNATLGEDSRTVIGSLDGDKYPVTWSAEGETLVLAEYINLPQDAVFYNTNVYELSNNNKAADFYFSLTKKTLYEGQKVYYVAGYPAGESTTLTPSNNRFNVTIPTVQTPTATSVDPNAVFMVARPVDASGSTQGFEQQPESLNLPFQHIMGFAKMTVKNLDMDNVESVTFSAPLGTTLTGLYEYNYSTGTGNAGLTNTSNSITINLDNVNNNTNEFDVWFAVAPCTLSSFDVKFSNNETTYTKSVNASTQLVFSKGQVSTFSINMEGIDDKEDEETYKLITTKSLPAKSTNASAADVPDSDWTPILITATKGNQTYILNNTKSGDNLPMTLLTAESLANGNLTVAPSSYLWEVVNRNNGYTFRSKGQGFLNTAGWLDSQWSTTFTIEKTDESGNYVLKAGNNYMTLDADNNFTTTATAPTDVVFRFYSTPEAVEEQESQESSAVTYTKVNEFTAGKDIIIVGDYLGWSASWGDSYLYFLNHSNNTTGGIPADFTKSGDTITVVGDDSDYKFSVSTQSGGYVLYYTATSYLGRDGSTSTLKWGWSYQAAICTYDAANSRLSTTTGGTAYLAPNKNFSWGTSTSNKIYIYQKDE